MEEVHLWRGTREQRKQRLQPRDPGHFSYFDRQLDSPDWGRKRVLDFGGNVGNLLLEEECTIRPENYSCVDVIREAVEIGRKRVPQAQWRHYDRYNFSFNPEGIHDLPIPEFEFPFDLILAYSVFTHTTSEEMHDLVGQLKTRLAPGGRLAFTFIDPHHVSRPDSYTGSNLRWRLERSREMNPAVDVISLMEKSSQADWCALVDGAELHVNCNGIQQQECNACVTYNVFYTALEMQRRFPNATIRPPVNGKMHHCCIMTSAT